MGVLILTLVLSILLGCTTWLVIGDRLPPKDEHKWETHINIAIYIGVLLVPIYVVLFTLF